MLSGISPSRIESIIENLVSFGTRNTLSVGISNATFGIGGARDWIAKEMRAIAATSGGNMVVTTPSYVQQPGGRISFPVNITDIVATIKGTGDSNRTYVSPRYHRGFCRTC
jgi:hypothetical protein